MTYARSERAREALWRLYRLRGHPKNLDVLERMLAQRAELARLLGYATWAAYVTEDKMIGTRRARPPTSSRRLPRAAEARMRRDYAPAPRAQARGRARAPSASSRGTSATTRTG